MSIYHKDKCTKEEAKNFRNIVISFLEAEKIPYSSVTALTAYDGEVRIYSGKKIERLSRRRVRQKDDIGYFLAKTEISNSEYCSTYRTDWNEEEKKELRECLKRRIKQ